jgi:hypothetical protein
MGNETDGTTQDEKSIKNTNRQILLGFFSGERTTVSQHVDEADGDAAIHVQDQVVLLGSGDGFDSNGVVKELVRREVLHNKVLDKLDTQVRVVARLDSMTDTGDCTQLAIEY